MSSSRVLFLKCKGGSGPVHTYPEIFVSANFFMRIHLASTRVRRIRSVYPEISVYAVQSGNFCIRIRVDARIRIFLYTLMSQYQNHVLKPQVNKQESREFGAKIIAGSAFFVMRMLC